MDSDVAITPEPVPTSRRVVLRTGAKLAYAAPLVAVTMKLAEQAAGAQVSGPTCFPDNAPCTITNFIQCCSQCCLFEGGDVNNGRCCDFAADAVAATQAEAGPGESFVVRQ